MTNIQDPEARGTMIFAWWMACLADAYHSAYYRRKPQLSVISILAWYIDNNAVTSL